MAATSIMLLTLISVLIIISTVNAGLPGRTVIPNRSGLNAGEFVFESIRDVDKPTDCALKTFATEYAAFIQPPTARANWTDLVQSALQLSSVCSGIPIQPVQPRSHIDIAQPPPIQCDWEVFVATNGSDDNTGTQAMPLLTVQHAVALSRGEDPAVAMTRCVTVRGGVYYHGAFATDSSQIGALSLTAIDSGLVIRAYNGEDVTFSAGTLLDGLSWSTYKRVGNNSIMMAKIPANVLVDWSHFNELYVDGVRAIRAKYPNGDPVYYGHGSTGWLNNGAKSWNPLRDLGKSVEIHVATPATNNSEFPQFQIGIGGPANNFNPPHSYWALASPPGGGGSTYVIPAAMQYGSEFTPRVGNWTNPSAGHIFAFHGSYWGSWVFAINESKRESNTLTFSRGGFQEGRGDKQGGAYYVSNIFEELDAPLEYYVDEQARILYFMPNITMPTIFVASQAPTILSMHGDSIAPVANVMIDGITFTHSPNNFMRDYETPSGGDWAIHRGGVVFLTGTAYVSFVRCTFTQLGGNAIVISDWNLNATITHAQFQWIADSGIVLVGQTDSIDGVSNLNQPTNTQISHSIFSEGGAYIKQSSFIFMALVRSTTVRANVLFNVPRACININDGFAGNHLLEYNLMFNSNRETGDHGSFNSWDRQPYLTTEAGLGPSLVTAYMQITHNFLINDYGGITSIDHDDGSAYYNDSLNFLVYSGSKNLFGSHKIEYGNIFIYPDLKPCYGQPVCGSWFSGDEGMEEWGERWVNNKCVQYGGNRIFTIDSCDLHHLSRNMPYFANNQYYLPTKQQGIYDCNGARFNLTYWQSLGFDAGSQEFPAPTVQTIIEWGRELLYPFMDNSNKKTISSPATTAVM